MRYIDKSRRCAPFDNYIAATLPANWQQLDGNKKLTLHQYLWAEQKSLCIYCQQSIRKKIAKDLPINPLHPSHIEHIRPKDATNTYAHLVFEHSNLAVSCNGNDVEDIADILPKYCGHAKRNFHDDALFLHPFEQTDIEDYFDYDLNGKITPSVKNVNRAQFTINLLKLDHIDLTEMRERQYQVVLEDLNNNGLDIEEYLDAHQPDLPKFHSMLKQLFYI